MVKLAALKLILAVVMGPPVIRQAYTLGDGDGGADPPAVQQPVAVPTPADAAALAALDLQTVAGSDQPFQRYFFTTDRSKEFYGAFNYGINTGISHASVLYRPPVVADGYLIRCDLRRCWPRAGQFKELFILYEQLAKLDDYFHVTSELVIETQVKVKTEPYKADDGKVYDYEFKTERLVKTGTEPALHLAGMTGDKGAISILNVLAQTEVPIFRADWFLALILSANEDYDGQYYNFRLIRDSNAETKESAEVLWLKGLGVDYSVVQKLRSDQRIGKWQSDITGKPRAVEYFYASSARPIVGPALTAMTRDFFDGPIKARVHPIKNLLDYKHDGTEAMGVLPNGMISWALFAGNGDLVRVAPQRLVTDNRVPVPHTANLVPPISCMRCHGPNDMWQPATNDVLALSKGSRGLNFFDDEADPNDPIDTLDRLAGLYAGEMAEPLRIARNAHAKATFIVTNGMQVPAVATKIAAIYKGYQYDAVTPQIACRELGWEVPEEFAVDWFNIILPPLPPNRHGVSPETVTIGTLRAWTPKNKLNVNRYDWAHEYADSMLRVTTEAIRKQALEAKEVQK